MAIEISLIYFYSVFWWSIFFVIVTFYSSTFYRIFTEYDGVERLFRTD